MLTELDIIMKAISIPKNKYEAEEERLAKSKLKEANASKRPDTIICTKEKETANINIPSAKIHNPSDKVMVDNLSNLNINSKTKNKATPSNINKKNAVEKEQESPQSPAESLLNSPIATIEEIIPDTDGSFGRRLSRR